MKKVLIFFALLFIFDLTLVVLTFADNEKVVPVKLISPLAVSPTIEPESDKILFVSDRGGNYDIYKMDLTTRETEVFFASPGDDMNPQISHDGKNVVFYSDKDGNNDIYLMDIETQGVTQLTVKNDHNYDPSFSPDGKHIVFKSTRDDDQGDIFIMNTDGTGQTNLTPTRDKTEEWDPVFNKNGDKIIFVVRSNSDHTTDNIYMMNTDGSGFTQITGNKVADWYPNVNSRDGSLVYISKAKPELKDDLFSSNGDGSGRKQLFDIEGNDADPAWDKSGKRIIFINDNSKNYDLYLTNSDGQGLEKIAETPSDELSPVFVP